MTPATHNICITRGVDYLGMTIIAKDANAVVVNLTGWTAFAQARNSSTGRLIRDLTPNVSNGAAGEVTIPAIPAAQTRAMNRGSCQWDLLLQQPSGVRLGPFLAGTFSVTDQPTQNP